MTGLKKRADALERQFAHQAELDFKAHVRRTAMLGRWAGYAMGLDDVEAYARTLAMRQVVEPHRLLEQLRADFCEAGVDVSGAELDKRVNDFFEKASDDVFSGR